MITSISPIRKQRHREVKYHEKSHTASEWQSLDANQCTWSPTEAHAWNHPARSLLGAIGILGKIRLVSVL